MKKIFRFASNVCFSLALGMAGILLTSQVTRADTAVDDCLPTEDTYGNGVCSISVKCPLLTSCKKIGTPMTTNCACICKIDSATDCTLIP